MIEIIMSAMVAFYHSCANRNQAKMTVKNRGGMFRNERKSLKHYCFADWQGALSFSTLGVDGGGGGLWVKCGWGGLGGGGGGCG